MSNNRELQLVSSKSFEEPQRHYETHLGEVDVCCSWYWREGMLADDCYGIPCIYVHFV
jgi:hypothetical protein